MCTVREVLSFDVQDKMNMLGFISNCYTRWVKCNINIFDIQVNFSVDFITDVCVSEGNDTNKECESVNMYYAYNYICEIKDPSVRGLLDPIFITEVHKRLFANIEKRAGFYSNNRRIAYFNGEKYEYEYGNMQWKVQCFVDRHNELFEYLVLHEHDIKEKFKSLFKISTLLLSDFLKLHPFFDGNGRLAKLMCNYLLSVVNPFAVPLCVDNVRYIKALINAQRFKDYNALFSIVLYANYNAWLKFNNFFYKTGKFFNQAALHLLLIYNVLSMCARW